MTSLFILPTFVPPTLESLTVEPDEVSLIVQQEAKIAREVRQRCPAEGRRGAAPPPPTRRTQPTSLRSPSPHVASTHLPLLQLATVREYNLNAEPLGVIAAQEDLESDQEDEALTGTDEGMRRRVTQEGAAALCSVTYLIADMACGWRGCRCRQAAEPHTAAAAEHSLAQSAPACTDDPPPLTAPPPLPVCALQSSLRRTAWARRRRMTKMGERPGRMTMTT